MILSIPRFQPFIYISSTTSSPRPLILIAHRLPQVFVSYVRAWYFHAWKLCETDNKCHDGGVSQTQWSAPQLPTKFNHGASLKMPQHILQTRQYSVKLYDLTRRRPKSILKPPQVRLPLWFRCEKTMRRSANNSNLANPKLVSTGYLVLLT